MILLINIMGVLLIAGIVWWFWLYKPAGVVAGKEKPVVITAESGVYQPANIQVPAERALTVQFLRKDASPCAESVIFPALGLSFDLPVGKLTPVNLPPLKPGTYEFHCQMKMYRGELRVE